MLVVTGLLVSKEKETRKLNEKGKKKKFRIIDTNGFALKIQGAFSYL